jgi:hypothetical protein
MQAGCAQRVSIVAERAPLIAWAARDDRASLRELEAWHD